MNGKRILRALLLGVVSIFTGLVIHYSPTSALNPVDRIDFENRDWVTLNGLNLTGFEWVNTWLTFSRIDTAGIPQHRDVVLRIHNRGAANLNISSFTISDTTKYTLPNGELVTPPPAIPPGGFYDLTVRFIYSPMDPAARGTYIETLTVNSDDLLYPSYPITLGGGYQFASAGSSELLLRDVKQAFGYNIDIGFVNAPHPQNAAAVPASPIGDEIFSKLWQRVNTTQPVYVRQLAAFHGAGSYNIFIPGGSVTHLAADYNTFFPHNNAAPANPAEFLVSPGGSYEPNVAGRTSCGVACPNSHGLRLYPLRDPSGLIIPNAFLIGMDFIFPPANAGSNFDYQDNIYIMTNSEPFLAADRPMDLALTGTDAPDPVATNTNFTYNLTITNPSIFTGRDSTLTLNFPAGVTVISAIPSQGTCNTLTPTLTCNLGLVHGERNATVAVVIQQANPGLMTTTATITTTSNDTVPANNTINLATLVVGPGVPIYSSTPIPGSTVNAGTIVVGSPTSTNIQVSEVGTAALNVTLVSITGANPGDFGVLGLPMNIADGGAPQNITVTCTPSAVGARSAVLTVQTNEAGTPTYTYNLTCTGTAAPISGYASVPAPGTVVVGATPVGTPINTAIQVSETGTATLNVSQVSLLGPNAADFGIAGLPMTILDGGAPQNITVTCTPSAGGLRTAALRVTTNEPGTPIYIYNLECTGLVPGYASNPIPGGTINAGSAVVGNPTAGTLQISEIGTAPLTVSLVSITGADAADFAVGGLPLTIPDGGAPQNVTVTCTPSAVGARTALLTVQSNELGNPTYQYPLTCTGTPAPEPGYASNPVPGGTITFVSTPVGTPVNNNLQISETGTAALNVAFVSITGANAGDFGVVGFPVNIPDGGGPVNVVVTCTPSGPGPRTATLTVQSNETGNPQYTYTLDCTGLQAGYGSTPAPGATINAGSSGIGVPVNTTFQINETGSDTLNVIFVSITGPNAAEFGVATFPVAIPDGGAPVDITVTCTPAVVGNLDATLNLTTNDPTQPAVTYDLDCNGVATPVPVYSSVPAPGSIINTGIANIGTLTSANLQVSEIGNDTLVVNFVSITGANAADFRVRYGGITFTTLTMLDGALPENLEIRCVPTVLGPLTAQLMLQTNEPGNPIYTYDLTCEGTIAIAPGYSSAPIDGSLMNVGTTEPNTTTSITLRVREVGTDTLIINFVSLTGPNGNLFEVLVGGVPMTTITILDGDPFVDITIVCTPDRVGSFRGILHLQTNELNTPVYTYDLRCKGSRASDDEAETTVEAIISPVITIFDPAISKIGFLQPGQIGVTGEQLKWVVTVTNNSSITGNNLVITDTLRPELRIDKVDTTSGTATVNGQTVTVNIPTLGPGQTVQINIFTTVLQGVTVDNTACVTATNISAPKCATGRTVISLPATGETPLWRNILIGIALLGIGLSLIIGSGWRKQRR